MPIETPVSDSNASVAPLDGMARFAASRNAADKATTAPILDTPAADNVIEPASKDDKPPAAAKAEPAADAVLDPETGEVIENPTRNDRRLAKLWKREQEQKAEVSRLLALLEQRNAAPLPETPEKPAGRPDEKLQALTPDQHLTNAAKARIRPEPDESEIGKSYPTYEAFVKDCAIWGGELVAEKRAIFADSQARQSAAQTAFEEQAKAYPDFAEQREASKHLRVGSAILDTIGMHPELSGHLNYWVMTHHDDVARISALPMGAALLEMGQVLAGIHASTAKADEAPDKKRSRAPAPGVDIGRPAGRASVPNLQNVKNMSEFMAIREPQHQASSRRVR